ARPHSSALFPYTTLFRSELDEPLHAGIRLVEERREDFRVAIDAERELREVVRADRKSVEDLRELFREDHVIRDLAHDVDLELVRSEEHTSELQSRENLVC